MVLVAVAGPVCSGKTTLLSSLANWANATGKSIDGFLALPQGRVREGHGAREYVLQLIASSRKLPFALRDQSLVPPYQINQKALDELASWADTLITRHPLSILILDEFGLLEASGRGHMAYWGSIQKADPQVLVIAVRDNLVHEIEDRLGLPFDVVIDATSPNALKDLQGLVLNHSDWLRVGQFGAASGGFEATVGSTLHQSRIPMSGLFLSTVQSLFMMYAGDRLSRRVRVLWVPVISAGLKALSPYGGRLRPMLAITVQGFLFTLAATLLGWNVVGMFVAGWLVGAWATLQGIVLQYFIIGDNLFVAIDLLIRWVVKRLHLELPGVVTLITLWTLLSGIVSAIITLVAWLRRHRLPKRFDVMLEQGARGIIGGIGTPTLKSALRRGMHDLLRPFFWAPVLIVALIVVASGSSWEQALWMVVRAVTVGWALFSVARLFNPGKLASWLRRKGHWGPAIALNRSISPLSKNTDYE
jgi:nucleoside-triphosphatase THEP1